MEIEKNKDTISQNNQSSLEYSKVQGFDVLEKLPEESKMKSYNEEYYGSLSNLKFLSVSIPEDNKLFYHFETNPNAPITTTIGQVYKTYQDLKACHDEICQAMEEISKRVTAAVNIVDNCDDGIADELKPEINKMEERLKSFLVEQKTETFKLIKEIAKLEKEKEELKNQIDACVVRLDKIEKDIGKNKNFRATYLETKPKGEKVEDTLPSDLNPKVFGDDVSAR